MIDIKKYLSEIVADALAKLNVQSNIIIEKSSNTNFGDYSTTFTDLTLKGTRVRGLHSTIKIGHFSIIYVRGKTKELIQSTHWEQQEINNPSVPGFYLNDSTIFLYYNNSYRTADM